MTTASDLFPMQVWESRERRHTVRILRVQDTGVILECLSGSIPIFGQEGLPWNADAFRSWHVFVRDDADIFDRIISDAPFRCTPAQHIPMTPMRRSVIAEIQEMEDREFLRAIREVIENRPEPKDAWSLLMESHDDLLP